MKIALIGFGAFGRFIADALKTSPTVEVAAIIDSAVRPNARQCLNAVDLTTALSDQNIAAVHIATPPHTHADLAKQALAAGKHVIIEKPLALTPQEGESILAAAEKAQRLVAVGYIMRYNAVLEAIRTFIAKDILGPVRYIHVDNFAHGVPLDHWFWDQSKSGGIQIEHGVHFIDAAAFVLGREPGAADGALYLHHGRNTEALATVAYGETIAVFWHGFIAEVAELESTEWHIVGERGWVRATGWIPSSATVTASASDTARRTLADAGWHLTAKDLQLLTAQQTLPADKQNIYAQNIRALWADVAGAIRSGTVPRASGQAGLASLTAAWHASQISKEK